MTYYKPKGLSITQIAQWVDSFGTTLDCDEDKLCEYLYHLVYFRTQQFSYFKNAEQIDDFCLYCVSRLYKRLRAEKTYGEVKSIANYIKNVISPWRAEYVKLFCSGTDDAEIADFDVLDYSDYLIDVASQYDYNAYAVECFKISDIVRKHLSKIPIRKNSSEWSNIYISCLMTLQDRINCATTLLNSKSSILRNPQRTDRVIRSLKAREPVLFHIDEVYANYITTLVNEIIHALSAEISYNIHSKVSVSACMRNLVAAACAEEED